MPKFKISFYRAVPEYAHLFVDADNRASAERLADNIHEEELEWVGGSAAEAFDVEYDIEEVKE